MFTGVHERQFRMIFNQQAMPVNGGGRSLSFSKAKPRVGGREVKRGRQIIN